MDKNFSNNKRIKKKKQDEVKSSHLVKIIALQMVLSLLITGVLFFVCSTETNLANNIKAIYSAVSEQDFAVSRWMGTFKDVVKQTFSPSVSDENVSGEITESETGEERNFSPVFSLV